VWLFVWLEVDMEVISCFHCYWAFIDSDYQTGIPAHLEECKCLDVAPDFFDYLYDKLCEHDMWDFYEEVLPRKCGHYIDRKTTCEHKEDEMGICWNCGSILNEYKLKEYERLHQYPPLVTNG